MSGDPCVFRRMIRRNIVTHHNTATAALYWLAMRERYTHITIIAIDGGSEYAPGVDGTCPGLSFTRWRRVQEQLAQILKEEIRTETEFLSDAVCDPGEDIEQASPE